MRIALVAHDSRKKELVEWVKYNEKALINDQNKIYATGTTAKLIKEALVCNYLDSIGDYPDFYPSRVDALYNSKIIALHSGPLGGDAEIGAMIAKEEIDVLIFFCDNLVVQGHQNDIYGLTRLASLYNIAFATNRTTADMILTSPLFKDPSYKRILPPAIENYKNRTV